MRNQSWTLRLYSFHTQGNPMNTTNRRKFMSDVGRGMLTAGLGATLASDLGLSPVHAADESTAVPFGDHQRLVELMRNTPAEKLQPLLAAKLVKGEVDLKQLISAGALANAVTFGGCDYVGFHTAMAMLPALEMSKQLDAKRSPLPVLKVLYRNSQQIQNVGGASTSELQSLDAAEAAEHAGHDAIGQKIREACRNQDVPLGERLLTTAVNDPLRAFNVLQPSMQDDMNVHRFVFAFRTYGLAKLLGSQHSYTLLRQCVRHCADYERMRIRDKQPESPIRALVPKLVDQFKLAGKQPGKRDPGDDYVDELSQLIYRGPAERSAEVVAAALAEGVDPEVVGEAISLASNLYVLRQSPTKKRVHGNSVGVHTSDATNAWRNMARIAEPQHAMTGLIVAAYHAYCEGEYTSPDQYQSPPFPTAEHRALIKRAGAKQFLAEAEDAVRNNDQGRAAAAVQLYGDQGYAVEPVFKLMLKYSVSEDGRLHAEKYYSTVREEYRTIRPAFRWRQIVGLARVTASAYGYNREDEHGFRAAGYEEACQLLGVDT